LSWLQEELAGRSARFCNGGTAPATRAYLDEMAESDLVSRERLQS